MPCSVVMFNNTDIIAFQNVLEDVDSKDLFTLQSPIVDALRAQRRANKQRNAADDDEDASYKHQKRQQQRARAAEPTLSIKLDWD